MNFPIVATFRDFPPRPFPPSFNPANIMETTIDDIKTRKMLKEGLDPDQVRGGPAARCAKLARATYMQPSHWPALLASHKPLRFGDKL
jgi:hypothetical protein